MRIKIGALAIALALGSGSASALTSDGFEGIPYVGGYGEYELPDSGKNEKDSFAYRAFAGYPLTARSSVELSYFDGRLLRRSDDRPNYDSGLFADYVYDFGLFGYGSGFVPNFKPFVLAGIGVERDDENGRGRGGIYHPGADVGAGLMFPISYGTWNWGWSLRTEARVVAEYNDTNDDPNYVKSHVPVDYHFGVGLSIPLGFLFHHHHAALGVPSLECKAAVVDPATGRADCSGDSDGDGVPDDLDQCPGTLSGVRVDARGCPIEAGNDEDGDGVLDSEDQCPHTPAGVKVDAKGCAIEQTVSLEDVTFETNSGVLTGRATHILDRVAQSLNAQANMHVEIGGYTDNVGDARYNLRLSEVRAESVKQYLQTKGVPAARMAAKGYGETMPVVPNDSSANRAKNRRVEFKITLQ